ncbi:MAG: sterol desaturase family protein [Niabella sp.]
MWIEETIQYFSTLEQRPIERMALLVGGLLFFWILEGAIPLVHLKYRKTKLSHAWVNFGFTVIHLIIHTFLAVFIVLLSDWCKAVGWGLVYWSHAGIVGAIVIGILALDFSSWWVHYIMHKNRFLWRFHIIHHSDNKVDVTTGLRHHPGDSLLRGIFFLILIFISGAPMYSVMMYQTLVVITTAFTHANISLPAALDKALSYIFISPNMHKVHHHRKQPYTDSNYGAVFSVWDRLFKTFTTLHPTQIVYGIDKDYPNEKDEDFLNLIKFPFQKESQKNQS